ncbi:MAG TPA: PQQ-binding-like beta-propeller repeat protein [Candidatus Baltobacteraceae bacterium]|nr:PQQ-binding-like beta-propeller repeat protein [Candidatus Baltobacteraceae bacterium]
MMARLVAATVGSACSLFALLAIVRAATLPVNAPAQWTQFRLQDGNNVALAGNLQASWTKKTGGPFSSSPTLSGGVLYVGNNNGVVSAIDPQSGKTLWSYHASNPIMSAPIVYGNAVIVGEGDENSPQGSSPSHPIRVGKPPSALIALDRRTGAVIWKVPLPGSGMPTPAIIDGILVHHNGAGHVMGIDPASGRVFYDRNLHSIASMVAALPMSGGRFVTSGIDANAVWMLNAKDGSVVWKSSFSPLASGIGDCPPVTDGPLIFCNYVMPPSAATPVQTERQAIFRAYAIDAKTGKRVWDTQLESGELPKRNEASIPLLADGTLYMGSSLASAMHAIDPKTGKVKWIMHTHAPVLGGIVDAGGTLYFGDLSGYLWAVDASNGAILGSKDMRTPFNVASPIVAGQTLIIGSRGGTLAAIPLAHIRGAHDATADTH